MAVDNFHPGQSLEVIFPITVDSVVTDFVDLADLRVWVRHKENGAILYQAAKETATGYDTIEAYQTTNGRIVIEASETAAAVVGIHEIEVHAEISHVDFSENFKDIGTVDLLNFI